MNDADGLPPKPPKLRKRPVEAQIGKQYGDRTAFLLDEQVWQRERDERVSSMLLREKAQDKRRHRRAPSAQRAIAPSYPTPKSWGDYLQ